MMRRVSLSLSCFAFGEKDRVGNPSSQEGLRNKVEGVREIFEGV